MTDITHALSHLQALLITGVDAAKFLQSQLSCNIDALPDHAVMAAICASSGRVTALGWLAKTSSDQQAGFIWILSKSSAEMALATLSRYKLRAKIQLQLLDTLVYANPAGLHPIQLPDGRSLSLGVRQAGDLSQAAFQTQDIESNYPWDAAGERFLPQMLRLEQLGGLSLKKGCFPGQEVISRLHYKGLVKRMLRRIELLSNGSQIPFFTEQALSINGGSERMELVQQSGAQCLVVLPTQADTATLDLWPDLQVVIKSAQS